MGKNSLKRIKKLVFLIFLLFIFSCGKKTDPISKDNFIIPEANPSEILLLKESGVVLKNVGKKYTLLVEKSEIIDNCTSDFKILTKVEPEKEYLDEDVKIGGAYIYRFYNLDHYLKKSSLPVSKHIIYSPPIAVKNFQYEFEGENILRGDAEFSGEFSFFKILLNGKEIKISRQNSFEILLEDKDINSLKIIPYDNYLNEGVSFYREIVNKKRFFLKPPSGFDIIKTPEMYLLSWKRVDGAKGYKLYYDDKHVTASEPFSFIPFSFCKIYVSSFNEVFESAKTEVDLCR